MILGSNNVDDIRLGSTPVDGVFLGENNVFATELDISAMTYSGNSFFIGGTYESSLSGCRFKPDGTSFYINGQQDDAVIQFNMSTPWNVTTAVYFGEFNVLSQTGACRGLFFKPDGTKLYVGDTVVAETVFQYTLSTPWNIVTASYDGVSFNTNSIVTVMSDIFFKPDGTKLYVLDDGANHIRQFTLSTPWNVGTASYDSVTASVTAQSTYTYGFAISTDGDKVIVVDGVSNTVFQYTLATPWDMSTLSYDNISKNVGAETTFPTSLDFKPDMSRLFLGGTGSDRIHDYIL